MTDWNDIVSRHGHVVWQTAWRMLGNHADALDCYQAVFMDAVQVVQRETVGNWPALLRRLATVRALGLLRGRYRQAERMQPLADPPSVVSGQPGPRQIAEATDLLERLHVELAALPDRQAEVFSLVTLEGMTCGEVATRMKLSTGAVGMLLSRARSRLRSRLASIKPESKRKE